jgi:hypothetical protein
VKDGSEVVRKLKLTMTEGRAFMESYARIIRALRTEMANPALVEQHTFRSVCRGKDNFCGLVTLTRECDEPSMLLINHWSWKSESTSYDEYVTPIFVPAKYWKTFMTQLGELLKVE